VSDYPVELTIGLAGGPHCGVLAELHAEGFEHPWDEASFSSLLATGARALIAQQSDQPVGMVVFRASLDEAEILTMATRPQSRRSGVAGQLLESAVQDLRSAGVTVLHLEVAVDNLAARALYNRARFVEVGCRRGYYRRGELRIDALVLTRELNSPPHCAYVPVI
jgi:[ribosomal protein S18]-alanine N-acetyltransferase